MKGRKSEPEPNPESDKNSSGVKQNSPGAQCLIACTHVTCSARFAKYHDLPQPQIMQGEWQSDPITLTQRISTAQGWEAILIRPWTSSPPWNLMVNSVPWLIPALHTSIPSCCFSLCFEKEGGTGNNLAHERCWHHHHVSLWISSEEAFQNYTHLLKEKEQIKEQWNKWLRSVEWKKQSATKPLKK